MGKNRINLRDFSDILFNRYLLILNKKISTVGIDDERNKKKEKKGNNWHVYLDRISELLRSSILGWRKKSVRWRKERATNRMLERNIDREFRDGDALGRDGSLTPRSGL